MVRDKIVFGAMEKLKERLLKEPDLTLEKATVMCQVAENVSRVRPNPLAGRAVERPRQGAAEVMMAHAPADGTLCAMPLGGDWGSRGMPGPGHPERMALGAAADHPEDSRVAYR
uniref:Uncharacterized protein n=1 Tax=Sphaerodactylus townsendi TaxID=933632 RepID=A0ACB8G9U4_9SAUR